MRLAGGQRRQQKEARLRGERRQERRAVAVDRHEVGRLARLDKAGGVDDRVGAVDQAL